MEDCGGGRNFLGSLFGATAVIAASGEILRISIGSPSQVDAQGSNEAGGERTSPMRRESKHDSFNYRIR
jgi:hypothetical protein